jgi:indolepyruvate ferredoxin oxidoreductase, alpha subunit
MGASISNAIGLKYAGIKEPVIATIGDSTFFHAGIPPAINAGWKHSPVVIAVLDNMVTGMTGHQASPASIYSDSVPEVKTIEIEKMLSAAGISKINIVDPYDIRRSKEAFMEAIVHDGPSGVVLRRVCSLVARRKGNLSPPYRVDADKCTGCLLCIRSLGCPAMVVESRKIVIDEVACAGCSMCAQLCPISAINVGV